MIEAPGRPYAKYPLSYAFDTVMPVKNMPAD